MMLISPVCCQISGLQQLLLGFSGFLQATEVLNLRPCDCEASGDMMKVRIVKLIS